MVAVVGLDGASASSIPSRRLSADRLRYFGAARQAEMLVAQECPLPWAEHRITALDLPFARNLDVHRWYLALTGRHWNGQADAFGRARNLANRRAHEATYDAEPS